MNWLGGVLLIAVALRHHTAQIIAPMTSISAPGVFYIQGGLWESLLCGVVGYFLLGQPKSVWRTAGLAAMAIGVIEGLQMSACRSLVISMADVPKGVNICDHVTGLPIGYVVMAMEVLAVSFILHKKI